MFEQYRKDEAYPKCVTRNIDPEIVAVEKVLIKPSLNGVPSRKKFLHSLNHAPDLRGCREGRNKEEGREGGREGRKRGGIVKLRQDSLRKPHFSS